MVPETDTPAPPPYPPLPRRTPGASDLRVFTADPVPTGRHRASHRAHTRVVPRRGRPVIVRLAAVLATGVFLVTGCTTGGSRNTTAGTGPAGLEKTHVTVRVLPAADVAPLYLAIRNGYFTAEGLTVEPTVIPVATDAITAMQRNHLDVVYSNYVSFFLAQSRGAAFRLVADGYQGRQDMTQVAVLPGSPIRTIPDLAGKRIGISTPKNIAELTASAILRTNGVNPATVRFVKVDNANMVTAMKANLIDAAYEMEPFLSTAQQKYGIRKIFDPMQGPTADIAIGGYATTEAWARRYPHTFAAFKRAMIRGQQAAADRAAVEAILPTFTKINAATASIINPGTYPTTLSPTRLARVVDLMVTYGLLPAAGKAGLTTMLAGQPTPDPGGTGQRQPDRASGPDPGL